MPASLLSLNSNLKGLAPQQWSLSFAKRLNILWGSNGSGKSMIQESVSLALTGQVSETFFRASVSSGALLSKMIPQGAPNLEIDLLTTDGQFSYTLKDGGRPKREACATWEVLNPAALREVLCARLEGQLEFFGEEDAEQDAAAVLALIPADLHKRFVASDGSVPEDLNIFDTVGKLKAWKKDADDQVKLLEWLDENLNERPVAYQGVDKSRFKAESKRYAEIIGVLYSWFRDIVLVSLEIICERASRLVCAEVKVHAEPAGFTFTLDGRHALSSGQEAALLAGLTGAMCFHERGVIILSDRGMAESMLIKLMYGLVAYPGYVFLAVASDEEPFFILPTEVEKQWGIIDAAKVRSSA